jgi:uncharacterized protein YdaU (DUF1376 family)
MSKDPAFLFYPGDWTLGTMHMSLLEKGAYMELLMLQFSRDKFTEAQAKHMLNGSFDLVWATISEKFKTDGEYYWNERLEKEKQRRARFTESRRNNALTPKNNNEHKAEHMQKHMENENENENKDINRYEILYKKVVSKNSISIPDGFESLILEWLKYKSEKGQSYKETGLKSLIKSFLKESESDSNTARAMLDYSMSKNYSGLFKETKINGKPAEHLGRRVKRVNKLWD